MSNATETAYNLSLARLLRHEGLNAEGEQRHFFGESRGQADVLLDFDDYAVVIEAEFGNPAKVDADKRFPKTSPAIVNGLPVRLLVAIGYPRRLANLPESETAENLAKCNDLRIAYRYFGKPWLQEAQGSVTDLARVLHDYWIQSDSGIGIEETVQKAASAIREASEILARVEPHRNGNQDGPATKSLIWLNAMLFQELLARHLDTSLLPPKHRDARILRPNPEAGPSHLVQQWIDILEINWWPIFEIAKETLITTPAPSNKEALTVLKRAAAEIAETGVIRRHDVAGRVFHRLLDSRKFLATNYTTVPAAIILAGLAFDDRSQCWRGVDFSDPHHVSQLKIVDPACGSGTLLMAATQEILKRGRRFRSETIEQREVVRSIIEKALYGFDVVPAAIHLAASTLCMAESRQVVKAMNLFQVQHDIDNGVARLGSLDFLSTSPSSGNAMRLSFFDVHRSIRMTGTGEKEENVAIPENCHLIIANPPFTRAGGPGDEDNTHWNPIFGSMLDSDDATEMKSALRKTLSKTPASLYAGLGSAFVVLAHEKLPIGGRMAFVLPATSLTGSRWSEIRRLLLSNYCVDWIVVSHDKEHRSSAKGLPGRLMVSFSESTRLGEILIIGTKNPSETQRNRVSFVNLRRNPVEPIEAMRLTRKLLAMDEDSVTLESKAIDIGGENWGSMIHVPQSELTDGAWSYAAFMQTDLVVTASMLRSGALGPSASLPISEVRNLADLGPYEMQVKNPKQGLFKIFETDDPLRPGIPALWHHKSNRIKTLEVPANARLERRSDKDRSAQDRMLLQQGILQFPRDLRMAPQRLAAVMAEVSMLGISSWITVLMREPAPGKQEALCLWLNSTLGLLLRIVHGNRPYLGRSRMPHELLRSFPVLDVDRLSPSQLDAAVSVYRDLKNQQLLGFCEIINDPVRCELNDRLCTEVLGIDVALVQSLTRQLSREPTMHARH
ncbi:MAG: hypothetical protein OXU79_08890 [Gemmatimonadota bacterium]|nr:hypothetical protein [Gemmatimonadota bacterium]